MPAEFTQVFTKSMVGTFTYNEAHCMSADCGICGYTPLIAVALSSALAYNKYAVWSHC
jgi:hypothetical protein